MSGEVLDARALNRALLARQGLLERSRAAPLDMIERLVGMQAQVPDNPYLALWSRLEDFRPERLSALIEERSAVRAALMRTTLHLVSARDCLAIHPLTQPLMARTFGPAWGKRLAGAEVGDVVSAGRELIAAQPRTRAELSAELGPRWPEADPLALAHAVTYNLPLVQVTPRGLWGASAQARWELAEAWLGAELDPEPDAAPIVLRYLAAFGPATTADIRTWAGIAGLREEVRELRPQLRSFRDERGRELVDVPDAELPEPSTPAPPRFLPEYDNVMLSHADRSRMLAGVGPGLPFPQGGRAIGTLLADGFYRANWKIAEGEGVATLTIDRFRPLPGDPPGTVEQIEAEGAGLLALVAAQSAEHRIEFVPAP